jgi:hypothetical protein
MLRCCEVFRFTDKLGLAWAYTMGSFVFWVWAGVVRRRDCLAGILTAVALLLATAGNLLVLSPGKLLRAATLLRAGQ